MTLTMSQHHPAHPSQALRRTLVIGLIGFLTLVDLFAAQAILPTLVGHYRVSRAAMGFAVNASTIGMAVSGLAVAAFGGRWDHRRGIWISLALLAIPTALLAYAPDLMAFTALRIVQGVCMSAAFTLTLAWLGEHCTPAESATATAAYVTGGVASNLVGRLISGSVADLLGLSANFYVFALLNLAGAALVYVSLQRTLAMPGPAMRRTLAAWLSPLRNPRLLAGYGIGFLILFAFLGVFTYVNFVLAAPPVALSPMKLGIVYFVFLPSMITTPFAGRIAARLGARPVFWAAMAVAGAGLPLLVLDSLVPVLAGLVLVGVGTFFAQAAATGYVGRIAGADRATAGGLYLASYYLGGLAGAAVLGQTFDRFGWGACVAGVALALAAIAALASVLRE
ncbi:putative MFS family arabinose efflux permease [Caulobacter ginsengisoli]|uniref:MFS family arabinose efflux permease n=1 Tax=Caulobacter ginsengisoli TaxID=400775 RepID=A0ABU0IRC7_9CAUL|nr:MFS transporter [Caulobacter ginsengisoli]MDQ0464576.1 putative MFS family arabinose efflux permease [Caulobacter ginsengisoli]